MLRSHPTRRAVLVGTAAALAAPSIIRAQTRRIVVRDLGIGTAFVDAYGREFTKATGSRCSR